MIREPLELIDIGVNLTSKRFDADREAVLARARNAGVRRCIITGTGLESSREASRLCRVYNGEFPGMLHATAGVHPHEATGYGPEHSAELRTIISESGASAVGETGLDFYRDFSPRPDQQRAFEAQLTLAAETGLPVFLHERDAHQRQIEILREYRDHLCGAVVHCFTGDRRSLYNYLDLDLYIGITGWLCDERRGRDLQAASADIPLERLMIETDAPYLLPGTLASKPKDRRNEPAFLTAILEALALFTEHPIEQLARITTANAIRFFRLDV